MTVFPSAIRFVIVLPLPSRRIVATQNSSCRVRAKVRFVHFRLVSWANRSRSRFGGADFDPDIHVMGLAYNSQDPWEIKAVSRSVGV
jgi:hypothetical protein